MSIDTARSLIDDQERLDRTLRGSEGAPARLLAELAASVPEEIRANARASLARGSPGMKDLVAIGRASLWLATAELIAALPSQRIVPFPLHERWDALLEIHRAVPEAAWLLAEVVASLGAGQRSLGTRVLLGVERRFGARGWSVLMARAGAAPLADLLQTQAAERRP